MLIRKTRPEDIEAIGEIYRNAKAFMRSQGNADQWSSGYPNEESATQDMRAGIGYVCEHEGEVVAVFAYDEAEEPTYNKIYEGKWLDGEKYAYIHRIAVKRQGLGIVGFCFAECFRRYPNLKIDTHRDNIPMQRALARAGFLYCGVIYLENGEERLAYQKNK